MRDIRKFALLKDHYYRSLGALKTIEILQAFYISPKVAVPISLRMRFHNYIFV
jgi:hypothetical protein